MKRTFKILLVLFLLVVLLLGIGLGVAWWNIDSIAKQAVETGSTEALQLKTTTGLVHVSLFDGDASIRKMRIANMPGYKAEHMMETKSISVSVEYASLWDKVLRIPQVTVNDTVLYIEQKGLKKNNASELMGRLKTGAADRSTQPSESPFTMRIKRVVFKNIEARVQLLPVVGKASEVKVVVPELVLDDVASEEGREVAMKELTQRLLPAVMAAVLERGQGVLPKELVGDISKELTGAVGAIGGEAGKLVAQAGKGIIGEIIKLPAGVGDKLKEGMEKLIPGGKKSEEEK